MESDSDGATEDFSGMELPPLITQLKKILTEYPDGGQIMKELIQNAEDAGATEIKFMFDSRNINQTTGEDKAYRKFFQGPALCVFNNAVFNKNDWKGIRMIYNSVKEDNPLQVGRFGLGFKSVFHLTDHPCILSADKLLLIDPQHKDSSKVNAMMYLKKLAKYERMDIKAFFGALNGTFGVTEDILTTGVYKGTLFWFPLRDSISQLSTNLYNEEKVLSLFEAIQSEKTCLLLFLKTLTSISLCKKSDVGRIEDIAISEVTNTQDVSRERLEFKLKIEALTSQKIGPPESCYFQMEIQNTDVLHQGGKHISSKSWLVVNYLMGNNASTYFLRLMHDPDLAYIPYVSIAAPFPVESVGDTIEGHVFCFLPLPREDTSLTGLPFHVNGFFALNQSRHHVKWQTEEQNRQKITDKAILWNAYLIEEALPLAFQIWIQKAVELSNRMKNIPVFVSAVHQAILSEENIRGKWRKMLKPCFTNISNMRYLYSECQNKWVSVEDALFNSTQTNMSKSYCNTIIKTLTNMGKAYVDIPFRVVETISRHTEVKLHLMTPKLFAKLLLEDQERYYQTLSAKEKKAILQYLFLDEVFQNVDDLQLLPLASGKWETFTKHSQENIFKCNPDQMRLFKGLGDRILIPTAKLPDDLVHHFETICSNRYFQMKLPDQQDVEMLLQNLVATQIPGTTEKHLYSSKTLDARWLQTDVWKYLTKTKMVCLCENVSLFPILLNSDWNRPKIDLVHISSLMIFKKYKKLELPDEVCSCLESLSVKIVPSLPPWINISDVQHYISLPQKDSVVSLMAVIQSTTTGEQLQHLIEKFNRVKELYRIAFMEYISAVEINEYDVSIALIKALRIFPGRNSVHGNTKLFSLNDRKKFATGKPFPIQYPDYLLDGYGQKKHLLLKLGACISTLPEMILLTLHAIQKAQRCESEVIRFMDFFLLTFKEIKASIDTENLEDIMRLARDVTFLKSGSQLKKPQDLFDSSDIVLQRLFIGENCCLESPYTEEALKVLRILGLKTRKDLSAEEFFTTAHVLDSMSKSMSETKVVLEKANALMTILGSNIAYLHVDFKGTTLKCLLSDIACIEARKNRIDDFPSWLPWKKHSRLFKPTEVKSRSLALLAGSVMPIVDPVSPEVSEVFAWECNIPNDKLILQFNIVKEKYKDRYKPNLLFYLRKLYEWLMGNCNDVAPWRKEKLIWTGTQFCFPENVVIEINQDDLKLEPYVHNIDATFSDLGDVFRKLGCEKTQNTDLLLKTLSTIASKDVPCRRDLNNSIKIIEKLAEKIDEIEPSTRLGIPIPIHTEDANRILFKPLDDCVYIHDPGNYISDIDEDDDDDEVTYFVHNGITKTVANTLNISSLQDRVMIDTETFVLEESGQEELLTTRLKTLVDEGYRDGLSVINELIQNADDAGAHSVKFLYDERENLDAVDSLLDKGMKVCQGPALWVYNNAPFSDEDFRNIRKLNGATKKENVNTIGKFGLGFCSVYNLTDVPSFISGTKMVILDPHKTHLPGSLAGLAIDFSIKRNKKCLKRYKDQFKPYENIFDCNLVCKTPNFNGTLFRLPLRTAESAKQSDIRNEMYSKKDVSELLDLFITNAGNILLFTQNIRSVEVYHLPSSALSVQEQSLIFNIDSECTDIREKNFHNYGKNTLARFVSNPLAFSEIQNVSINLTICEAVSHIDLALQHAPINTASSWIVSWAAGTRASKALSEQTDMVKAIPLAAVAVPYDEMSGNPMKIAHIGKGFFNEGHLYCFLPIPWVTKLPWHLHGCFDVTSDRKQLTIFTEHDKSSKYNNWNECLLSDAALNAFIKCLLHFTDQCKTQPCIHYDLWPVITTQTVEPFVHSFYSHVVKENIQVFRGKDRWLSFSEIIILDQDIRTDETIGDTAYEMLTVFTSRPDSCMVDLPTNVIRMLEMYNLDDIGPKVLGKEETILVFLENITDTYWIERTGKFNCMILYALSSDDPTVENKLKQTYCIPCEKTKKLRLPNELIHPSSKLSSMYESADGRFLTDPFKKTRVLRKLVKLGMVDTFLPVNLLIDRCHSIAILAQKCCTCAKQRTAHILNYLSTPSTHNKYTHEDMQELRNICWLPILAKPSSWTFTWNCNKCSDLKYYFDKSCLPHQTENRSLFLGKPCELYRLQDYDYIGAVGNIVDENEFILDQSPVWSFLGILPVEGHYHTDKVVKQFSMLSEEYNDDTDKHFRQFQVIYGKVISYLHEVRMSREENIKELFVEYIRSLCYQRVVMISPGKLVYPHQVAVNVREDCYPYLCRLPTCERIYKDTYIDLGIKTTFSVSDVMNALKEMKNTQQMVGKEEAQTFVKMLQNLTSAMEEEGNSFEYYTEYHDQIICPDISGCLYPTYELAFEDESFQSSVNLKLVHEDVPVSLGMKLGMKTKKSKCLQQIAFAIPWGQTERLVTRIKGLLKDYPCGEGIMKELLQNADDANADELHFIKDYRFHATDKIFDGSDKRVQGPALCVYNDNFFTENDMQGIKTLGMGSKQDDISKTGKYGIGFNSVYHLTDTPSFLTKGPDHGNGLLCMLDPLCKNIPVTETNPGIRCAVDEIRKNFPDILSGYLENEGFFNEEKGTMFRFPLRTEENDFSSETIKPADIDNMLNGFKKDMINALLFVKSVKKIKISNISTGTLKQEYAIQVELSEEDELKRNDFFKKVKQTVNNNKSDPAACLYCEIFYVEYIMQLKDSNDHNTKWLIVQSFGGSNQNDVQTCIHGAFNDEQLRHIPIGGVALHYPDLTNAIETTDKHKSKREPVPAFGRIASVSYQFKTGAFTHGQFSRKEVGQLFAFLPLPVTTGFSVHINGHFSLDRARRDLWKDGNGHHWNLHLASSVIVPSWITAIKYFQKYFTQHKLQELNICTWQMMNEMMSFYHGLFPTDKDAKDGYPKELVKQFYERILHTENEIFPVIGSANNAKFSITWVPLNSGGRRFGAVFNNILSEMSSGLPELCSVYREKSFRLETILKKLGMYLIKSPLTFLSTMKTLKFDNIASATPTFVLEFLRTCSDETPGTCVIGELNTKLPNTNIGSIEELKILLKYIQKAKTFSTRAEGLPVLLTRDNRLNQFSKSSTVFHSCYGYLFPRSQSVFVHDELLPLLEHKHLFSERYLQTLDIRNFKLLLENEEMTGYKSQGLIDWNKDEAGTVINRGWLRGFFSFIKDNSRKKNKNESQAFLANIKHFSEYSFLPAIYTHGGEHKTKLLEISMAYCLYEEVGFFGEVHSVIGKLQLPFLDMSVFADTNDPLRSMIETIPTTTYKPVDLLRCLHHHRSNIINSSITHDDATTLLLYFDNHVKDIQVSNCKQMLKQLPLYCTRQNTLESLDKVRDILILTEDIPDAGIQAWAFEANILLLKNIHRYEKLYKFLDIPSANALNFYTEKLVPNISLLPSQHWLVHISFIKFTNMVEDSDELLCLLKSVPFMYVGGKMKTAKALYWPNNLVFSLMLSDADFPPQDLRTVEWKPFFESLEMKFDVTDEMFLDFAHAIETQGRIISPVRKQSEALLNCFMNKQWNEHTIRQVKTIKFICPFEIDEKLSNIYNQPNEASLLISFKKSVSTENEITCWSSVNLLPEVFDKYRATQLGVFDSPPIEAVIRHCQNVSTVLADKIERGQVETNLVKKIMSEIYQYFDGHVNINYLQLRQLESFPTIHLYDSKRLIQARAIVLSLAEEQEIKPYLYRAPLFYGQYFELFKKMGSKDTLEIGHSMYVLKALKNEIQDEIMNPRELYIVQGAVLNLLYVLKERLSHEIGNEILYLPNRDKILKDSTILTVSDSPYYELLIDGKIAIDYFIGFESLDIKQGDPYSMFERLPLRIRPKMLSSMLTEQVNKDNWDVVEESWRAVELEEFLHSGEFVAGVLRIVKHDLTRKGDVFDEEKLVPQIRDNIIRTKVKSVNNIKAHLLCEGCPIPNLDISQQFFISDDIDETGFNQFTIYIREDNSEHLDTEWVSRYSYGLIMLVNKCTLHLQVRELMIMLLFSKIRQRSEIAIELDRLRINPFYLSLPNQISAFPNPGTPVEAHFHPFLEQTINAFEKEEYGCIAMEIEDDIDNENEPVYIYVRIVNKVTDTGDNSLLHTIYLVNTGNVQMQNERIPIYRLYRFVRRTPETGSDLVVYDSEPINAIPFDTTCMRIRDMLQEAWALDERDRRRVILRLRARWHSDQNSGNEEYANRVFNYISNVILLLERGQQVSSVVDERTGREAPDMSQSQYHNMVQSVDRRTEIYSIAFRDNIEDYNRSNNTGRYSHAGDKQTPRQDIIEARRWMKQAKADYRAANAFNTEAGHIQGYNWICYTCHQACEKALRAAHFSRNANEMPGRSHRLMTVASALGNEVLVQVREMENRLTDFNRMRYPEYGTRPDIPSDLYTEVDAIFALEKTNDIINIVVDQFNIQ